MLRSLREQRAVASIEGLDDDGTAQPGATAPNAQVRTLAVVPNPSVGLLTEPRYLQATIALPQALVTNALAVQAANREYQERALARGGLQRMYIGTLTLSLFLAVFGAVVLAIVLGNQLARPLLLLAQGMRDVARGDLRPKPALQTRDEIGGLTRSFALMTQQLADARAEANRSMGQLDAARGNLQTILDNLTSGVIVLDARGAIVLSNPGATRILRAPMAVHEGRALSQVPGLEQFGEVVQEQFALFLGEQGRDRWQLVHELHASTDGGVIQHTTTLVMRGAELPDAQRLLVFDDISEIVSAQRAQAWGEARRVAHEIKNPLTPIQLSAERMAMRLTDKLQPADQALLAKSVKTIVDQVGAMKRLVDEFRDYARLPAANLQSLDLNALVTDVLQLYGEENAEVRVECAGPAMPADFRRWPAAAPGHSQSLQNAQDATAQRAQESGQPRPRDHRDALERVHAPRAPEHQRQRHGLRGQHPSTGLRALCHDQGAGHRTGPGRGQENRRRAWRPHRPGQQGRRRVIQGAQVSLSFAPERTG